MGRKPNDHSERPVGDNATQTLVAIGRRIRELRKGRGMTLQALANASGVSSSMLSLVERGRASPSIGSLIVVGEALGRSMSDLLNISDYDQECHVVRGADARSVITDDHVLHRLMKEDRPSGISIEVQEHVPATASIESGPGAEGFIYAFVIEGHLTFESREGALVLAAGDLVSCAPHQSRRIVNHGNSIARSVWFRCAPR